MYCFLKSLCVLLFLIFIFCTGNDGKNKGMAVANGNEVSGDGKNKYMDLFRKYVSLKKEKQIDKDYSAEHDESNAFPSDIRLYMCSLLKEFDFNMQSEHQGNKILLNDLFQVRNYILSKPFTKYNEPGYSRKLFDFIESMQIMKFLDDDLMYKNVQEALSENRGPKNCYEVADLIEYIFYRDVNRDICRKEKLFEFGVFDVGKLLRLDEFKKLGYFEEIKQKYMNIIKYLTLSSIISNGCKEHINDRLVSYLLGDFDNLLSPLPESIVTLLSTKEDRLVLFVFYVMIRRLITLNWDISSYQRRVESNNTWTYLNSHDNTKQMTVFASPATFREKVFNKFPYIKDFLKYLKEKNGIFDILDPEGILSSKKGAASHEEFFKVYRSFKCNFGKMMKFYDKFSNYELLGYIFNEYRESYCKYFFKKIVTFYGDNISFISTYDDSRKTEIQENEFEIKNIRKFIKKDTILEMKSSLIEMKQCSKEVFAFIVHVFKVFRSFAEAGKEIKDIFIIFPGVSDTWIKETYEVLRKAYIEADLQVNLIEFLEKVVDCNYVDKILYSIMVEQKED